MHRFFIILPTLFVALHATQIEFNKNFYLDIMPDKMNSQLIVKGFHHSDQILKTHLEKVVKTMQKRQNVCTGGGYRIYPVYDYKQQPATLTGYQGRIQFNCEFQAADELDRGLSAIKEQMAPSILQLEQTPITWNISLVQRESATEQLRQQAIAYALSYRSELNRLLGRCQLTNIDFNPDASTPYPKHSRMMVVEAKQDTTTAPVPTAETVSLTASFTYECR